MGFAHVGFAVKDLQKSKEFYSKALAPLGITLTKEKADSLHFGKKEEDMTMLWLHTRRDPTNYVHISFEADTRRQVDDFYSSAIAAGGKDNGTPGVRENYSPDYYAAFVLDPDGHNIEVICWNT